MYLCKCLDNLCARRHPTEPWFGSEGRWAAGFKKEPEEGQCRIVSWAWPRLAGSSVRECVGVCVTWYINRASRIWMQSRVPRGTPRWQCFDGSGGLTVSSWWQPMMWSPLAYVLWACERLQAGSFANQEAAVLLPRLQVQEGQVWQCGATCQAFPLVSGCNRNQEQGATESFCLPGVQSFASWWWTLWVIPVWPCSCIWCVRFTASHVFVSSALCIVLVQGTESTHWTKELLTKLGQEMT